MPTRVESSDSKPAGKSYESEAIGALDGEAINAQCTNGMIQKLTVKYTADGLQELEIGCTDGESHNLTSRAAPVEGESEMELACEKRIKQIAVQANVTDASLVKGIKLTCDDDSTQEWISGADADQENYSEYRSLCTYNYEFVGFYGRYLNGIVRIGQKCGTWAP